MENLTFIDLFAGAGGLSEGFIRVEFEQVENIKNYFMQNRNLLKL